jgi:hypothetical protein
VELEQYCNVRSSCKIFVYCVLCIPFDGEDGLSFPFQVRAGKSQHATDFTGPEKSEPRGSGVLLLDGNS